MDPWACWGRLVLMSFIRVRSPTHCGGPNSQCGIGYCISGEKGAEQRQDVITLCFLAVAVM